MKPAFVGSLKTHFVGESIISIIFYWLDLHFVGSRSPLSLGDGSQYPGALPKLDASTWNLEAEVQLGWSHQIMEVELAGKFNEVIDGLDDTKGILRFVFFFV